jgi:hypothetical protein
MTDKNGNLTGWQRPMRFNPPHWERLQGAAPVKQASHVTGQADARRRARRRPVVRRVPDNKADAVPCERLQKMNTRVTKGGY